VDTTFLRVLDGTLDNDRETWRQLWQEWPDREVFANPDYVQLVAKPGEKAACAVYKDEAGSVMFPLIIRPIRREVWAEDSKELFDLTTPYGYGGPFVQGRPYDARFWALFSQWARQRQLVSLYTRLTLFPEDILAFEGNMIVVSHNVVRSLEPSIEQIWADYEHKVRKNVNKASRSGLTVNVDLTGDRLQEFLAIYHATMERRNADEYYFFSAEFFQKIVASMPGNFAFFYCDKDGIAVSVELALVTESRIYSFLGGTLPDFFPLRPNDLLKHEMIVWAKSNGKKEFVLGGGQTEDDGIFRYKVAFATQGIVPYCIGTKVFDMANYDYLCQVRKRYEEKQGREWDVRPDYFPAYRW